MKHLFIVPLWLAWSFAFCQNQSLNGTVQDENSGEKIPGAIVQVENSFSTAVTDYEGKFEFKNLKQGNFEAFLRSTTGNPFIYNFQPILHTSSAGPDGLNYTAFGTPESDKIIEALYDNQNETAKAKLLKRLQEILHDESNLVFLYFQKDRIVVRKGFTNLKISGIKPGYDVSAFKRSAD